MKKHLTLITILLLFFLIRPKAQSVYYDAKFLKEQMKLDTSAMDVKKIATIFSKYVEHSLINSINAEKFIDSFRKENPFLSNYFIFKRTGQGIGTKFKTASGILNSISGINVTSIADGLARFLIERGREELNAAFFNQLKEFLNDPKHEECKILFPETIDLLNKIDSYKYAAFLENLRNNFHTDLNNLIIHLKQVIDLPKYELLIADHPEIKLVLGSANIVSELSQSGKSILPDSVIKQLALLPWDSISRNLGNSLKLLNLLSQSIRADTSLHQSWVSLSDLNTNLFADSITLRIYFGLIYQQVKSQNITFYSKDRSDSIRMDTLLARQKNHIFRLSGLIQNFSLLADDVQNSISDY